MTLVAVALGARSAPGSVNHDGDRALDPQSSHFADVSLADRESSNRDQNDRSLS
jgi:hypothetical protein